MKKCLLLFLALIVLSQISFASIAVITRDYDGSLIKIAAASIPEINFVTPEGGALVPGTNMTNGIEWGIYFYDKKAGTIWKVNGIDKKYISVEQFGTDYGAE